MPIEGDLRSLNLSSVLQLVGQERLNGVLRMKKRGEIADIGFQEGLVTGAFYERGDKAERLETYLVKSGIIGKNVFELVQEIHNETKRPIMNIIIEDHYLSVEEVERIIMFKIQEVFDELFTWEEGEFKFEQSSVIYPKSMIKIRMNTSSLILEAARRFDEWPRIKKVIASGDIVYKKVDRPELKLKPADDEERLLTLLDGRRSVDELTEISGLGRFRTYSCLYHLLSSGQIEIAYAKPTIKKAKRERKPISLKFLIMPIGVAVMIIGLIIEFLIGNYLNRKNMFNIKLINESNEIKAYEPYKQIFFYKHNRMPSNTEVRDIFHYQ